MGREELVRCYREADALFLHLKDVPMFKRTIPSKIFEYVSTGKPVVYGVEGVAKKILKDELGCEYSFSPGNSQELKKTLNKLLEDFRTEKVSGGDMETLKRKYLRSRLSKRFVDISEGLVR